MDTRFLEMPAACINRSAVKKPSVSRRCSRHLKMCLLSRLDNFCGLPLRLVVFLSADERRLVFMLSFLRRPTALLDIPTSLAIALSDHPCFNSNLAYERFSGGITVSNTILDDKITIGEKAIFYVM